MAWATLAMVAGLLPVVVVILLTRTVPPTGIALVPVVGILAGNTMNGHTLTCRRAFAALREEKGQYEAALSLGLTRAQAVGEVVHRRVPEALIPGLDQVRTAGVVTLPGAFIGVLLGGGSPAQAAAAQVLVLMGIMAAQTTTAVVAERLIGAGAAAPRRPQGLAPALTGRVPTAVGRGRAVRRRTDQRSPHGAPPRSAPRPRPRFVRPWSTPRAAGVTSSLSVGAC